MFAVFHLDTYLFSYLCDSKCNPQTSSIGGTRELDRNTEYLPQIRTLFFFQIRTHKSESNVYHYPLVIQGRLRFSQCSKSYSYLHISAYQASLLFINPCSFYFSSPSLSLLLCSRVRSRRRNVPLSKTFTSNPGVCNEEKSCEDIAELLILAEKENLSFPDLDRWSFNICPLPLILKPSYSLVRRFSQLLNLTCSRCMAKASVLASTSAAIKDSGLPVYPL